MKIWVFLLSVIIAGGHISALEVAEQEIRVDSSVRFQSNEGVPDKVETADQIRGIGTFLAANADSPERQYFGRYRLIHAVDPSRNDLFDADILILESSSAVDHIRNLRLIIAGYLAAAYGYADQDSALLAEFITIYNAVYRKNMQYFDSKYKPAVLSHLDGGKAGLATSYTEWPGATQILIPLSDGTPGSLNAVDTSLITDEAVIGDLQAQDDKGIDSRKDIVDLKERQIEEQERQTETEKKEIQEERRQVEQQEQRVQQELAGTQEKKAALDEGRAPDTPQPAETAARSAPDESRAPDSPQPAETAAQSAPGQTREEQRESLEKQESALREEQSRIEETKKSLDERESSLAAQETRIEEKKEEVREDRREIAKDQEEILSRDSLRAVQGIPFIKVDESSGGLIVLIDPETGGVLSESPEPPLSVRVYEPFGGGIAVILQRSDGSAGRLSILERGTLKEKIAAREEIFTESSFQVNGNELFAVIRDTGKWYLGKYDTGLALLARSRTEVNPRTFILFSEAHVFVEDPGGKVVPLALADMN